MKKNVRFVLHCYSFFCHAFFLLVQKHSLYTQAEDLADFNRGMPCFK